MLTDFLITNFKIKKSGRRMFYYLSLLFVFLIFSCNSSKNLAVSSKIPGCLMETVKKMSADISEGAPVSITQFTYHGQKVYYMINLPED